MRLGTYLIIAVATTRLKQALAVERALGRTDPTTEAANARAFREAAEREMARMARSGGPLSVAYLDLDDFKLINDGLGHAAGDRVLRRTAEVLMEHARATDVVARLGGDEFVVLLPDTPAVEAVAAAERLRSLVADGVNAGPNVVRASAGVATFVTPPRSVEQLITFADQQMYEAKRLGKDRSEHRIVLEPEAQQASG
jgi:diguanylate cyclase (GGDEF)-like protein